MHTSIRNLITMLVLGLTVAAAMPATTQAQETSVIADKPANWTEQFDKQIALLLRTPDTNRQERAMQLIIHYSKLEDASGRPVFDFSSSTSRLLDIYKHTAEPGPRLLSLAALYAIGSPSAMQELAATVRNERSEVVRKRAILVLSAHLEEQR